ncbi:MAG: hypothetical protein JWL89_31 [Candidatus Saccharibacteria bacterium]|jgi:hypothetical protein|nr:hypothetical protein [Candidatus Saccharibacteria bacterium]
MDLYDQIAVKIIAGQETIIGPVAIEQASQVKGLQIDWANHKVSITGDKATAIEHLVERYKELFGQISVEVSKQAAASLMRQLPTDGLPAMLK